MVILKIFDFNSSNVATPLSLEDEYASRIHKFNGSDVLQFEIQRNHEIYSKIKEEVKVEAFGNRFVIKQIDEHSDFVVVNCELDFIDWKKSVYKNFRKTNETIVNVLAAIKPIGWTITYSGVDISKRTTIEESDGEPFKAAIAIEILNVVSNAYGVVFNFDIINKKLEVINPKSYTPSGEFIMENLNLTEIGFNGDSSGLITRLYVYGKKDESTGEYLTIKSVNGNKEYIDNFQYTNEVICGSWVDERYTVVQNLYDDAVKMLQELSAPKRSYSCDIINFNGDVWLYKVVTLIDKSKKQRVNHQVVEFREYKNHALDKCVLSTQTPDITEIIKSTSLNLKTDLQRQKTEIHQVIDEKTQQLSDTITGSNGGHFKWVLDADGNMEELVNLYDSDDITTAQKVWRWNSGGLGHSNNGYNGTYGLALTKDGEINASMITTGILNAGIIRAGTIQDVVGKNSWNLQTGALTTQDATMTNVTIDGGKITTKSGTKKAIMENGFLRGYRNDVIYGLLDLSPTYSDSKKRASLWAKDELMLQAGGVEGSPTMEIKVDKNGIHPQGLTGWNVLGNMRVRLDGGLIMEII